MTATSPAPAPAPTSPGWARWVLVVATVGVVVLAGVLGWVAATGGFAAKTNPAAIRLETPRYSSLVCLTGNGGVAREIYFLVEAVSAPVSTAQFSLSLVTVQGVAVAPGDIAPPPSPDLPCSAPLPPGWYGMLTRGAAGPVATYPASVAAGGTAGWSTSNSSVVNVMPGDEFVLVTVRDLTGSSERIAAAGTGGANVEFTGNTTVPPFQNP
ncbi:MAG: hypothetical protein ACRECT_01215 [Thermoplasmata archaeon]